MILTDHFTLEEMLVSEWAARNGINNAPSGPFVIENLRLLCVHVLEPLRRILRLPIIVTSGFRHPTVNKAIGGSETSDHMQGRAADIIVPRVPVAMVFDAIAKNVPFDQVIDEFGQWTHVSYRLNACRGQKLIARFVNGKPQFTPVG
jgi:hypothetical protein